MSWTFVKKEVLIRTSEVEKLAEELKKVSDDLSSSQSSFDEQRTRFKALYCDVEKERDSALATGKRV